MKECSVSGVKERLVVGAPHPSATQTPSPAQGPHDYKVIMWFRLWRNGTARIENSKRAPAGRVRRGCVPCFRELRRGDHWSPAKRLVAHPPHPTRCAGHLPLEGKALHSSEPEVPLVLRTANAPAHLLTAGAGGLRLCPRQKKPALRKAQNGSPEALPLVRRCDERRSTRCSRWDDRSWG